MDIQLRTNQPDPSLRLRDVTRFEDGSGYRAVLEVRSRGFEVRTPFYFEPQPLAQFLDELLAADRTLSGSAKLKPLFEDHFIELTLTPRGRVVVRGEVFEYSEHAQHLGFEFETDQTVLKPLIDQLRECLGVPAV
jgi:hypothetical protein